MMPAPNTWDRFIYLLTTQPEFYFYSVLAFGCVVGLVISVSRLAWLLYEELRYAWYRYKRGVDG
jgi:hypothetical protein